jgi:hypothetical protein
MLGRHGAATFTTPKPTRTFAHRAAVHLPDPRHYGAMLRSELIHYGVRHAQTLRQDAHYVERKMRRAAH